MKAILQGLLPILVATQANSQKPPETIITGGPTCTGCTITASRIAVVGDENKALVSQSFAAHRDLSGRFWISSSENGEEVVVFDGQGRFLRTYGRQGRGPGEFSRIRLIAAHGNQIHLIDSFQRRATVVNSNFEVLRTYPVPVRHFNDALVLPTGEILINGAIPSRSHIGLMLHVLDTKGNVARSFDEADESFVFGSFLPGFRSLTHADTPGEVWSSRGNEYRLTRWTAVGQAVQTVHRQLDWFKPHKSEITYHPKQPPLPWVMSLARDSVGLLWVFIARADNEWHKALVPDRATPGGYTQTDDWDQFFDTVVEVLDLKRGQVIASARFDQFFLSSMGGGYVASYKESAFGTPQLQLWRLVLNQPRR